MSEVKKKTPWWLLAIHWIIIINFIQEIFYASYIVFVVLKPEGVSGPLWSHASDPKLYDLIMMRRGYATECWLAIGGLAIYLALTEIGPRLKKYRGF